MKYAWIANLKTEEDKNAFKERYVVAVPVLDRLKEIVLSNKNKTYKEMLDPNTFKLPAWTEHQAT
ncbi:MAG: hypothetical protein ACWGQW_19080, partial [bacterium]